MKMLLSVVAVAGLGVSCGEFHQHVHALLTQDGGSPKSAAAAVGGRWQLSLETPQGPMTAGMDVRQDGTRISGTCHTDQHGPLAFAGTLDGKQISFSIELEGGRKMTFSGSVEANRMSGTSGSEGGNWSATRAPKEI